MSGLSRLCFTLFTAICLVPVMHIASAVDVYKWTAGDGTIHFSEKPPVSDIGSLEVMQISGMPPQPGTAPPPASYEQVLELASRLQADRLAREQVRLEGEALRLKRREARREEEQRQEAAPSAAYYPPYYRYPQRPFPPRHRLHRPPDRIWQPGQRGDLERQQAWRQQEHRPKPLRYATQQAQRTTGRGP